MPQTRRQGITATVSNIPSVALGTLANKTGVLIAGPVMTRGGRLISLRMASIVHTLTAGDGPFLYGISDKSLSLAELEAFLEQNGPVTPSDKVAMELQSRGKVVRTLGIIAPVAAGLTAVTPYLKNESVSGLRFTEEEAGWNYWIWNMGPALTAGSTWQSQVQSFVEFQESG